FRSVRQPERWQVRRAQDSLRANGQSRKPPGSGAQAAGVKGNSTVRAGRLPAAPKRGARRRVASAFRRKSNAGDSLPAKAGSYKLGLGEASAFRRKAIQAAGTVATTASRRPYVRGATRIPAVRIRND